MKDLDILEKEILKSIERCSIFHFVEIRQVYEECNSFDKTILILKYAANTKVSLNESILRCK